MTYKNIQLKDFNSNDIFANAIPGSVMPWFSDTIPVGWILMNGQAISRATYARLFSIIGIVGGSGDGSTTFNLPNIKDRTIVGKDSSDTTFDTIGETAGSKYTEAHKHPFRVVKDSNSNSGGGLPKANNAEGANSGWSAYVPDTDSNCAVGTFGIGNAGNIQPSIVSNYIIKY
jgi:microcystin-dependent protein